MSPYIECESPVSYGRKVMCRVEVFLNVGQWSHGQGHVIKIYSPIGKVLSSRTHPAQYKSPMPNGKKVMCRVKFFQM